MLARGSETAEHDHASRLPHHGGSLGWARQHFPEAPRPWIDLSTGINPYPWPRPTLLGSTALRLPDPKRLETLEVAAATSFGADASRVAAVPGAEIGLRLLPSLLGTRHIAVVSPTYCSHAEAWAAADAEVALISRDAIYLAKRRSLLLVNPNNPDGSIVPPDHLQHVAAQLKSSGDWLIVDESFCEVSPKISVAPAQSDNIVVIRSFGKFYGHPGLRLGFIVAPPLIISRLRTLLGDWPVSGEAIEIGCRAYSDHAWQDKARQRLNSAAQRLDKLLDRRGLRIIGGTSLFRLVETRHARHLFQRLAEAGILVRAFADEPRWLRLGLPRGGAWQRLEDALVEVCHEQ